jgi:hypothetical protein
MYELRLVPRLGRKMKHYFGGLTAAGSSSAAQGGKLFAAPLGLG